MKKSLFGGEFLATTDAPEYGGAICSYTAKDGTVIYYKCDDKEEGLTILFRHRGGFSLK